MMARDGFGQALRAEWTKLRSVRRWTLAMLSAIVLTVVFGLIAAAGSKTEVNEHPDFVVGPDGQPVVDEFFFVHQPLSGDGTISARILTQAPSHEWAGAGVMVKERATTGSPYAALMVTPGHGVRLQANFTTDRPGGAAADHTGSGSPVPDKRSRGTSRPTASPGEPSARCASKDCRRPSRSGSSSRRRPRS